MEASFVVEMPMVNPDGNRAGTGRLWVASQARAEALAAEVSGRTWRATTQEERDALEARKARANAGPVTK